MTIILDTQQFNTFYMMKIAQSVVYIPASISAGKTNQYAALCAGIVADCIIYAAEFDENRPQCILRANIERLKDMLNSLSVRLLADGFSRASEYAQNALKFAGEAIISLENPGPKPMEF